MLFSIESANIIKPLIFLVQKSCIFKIKSYLCNAFNKSTSERKLGEVAEWSIAAVLKTVVPRGTRGSNPCLSAIKGVNQAFARFTPFFTPKNAIRTKLGSGNIPFIGYFVITTLIQTKYPQKISTNNYNKN